MTQSDATLKSSVNQNGNEHSGDREAGLHRPGDLEPAALRVLGWGGGVEEECPVGFADVEQGADSVVDEVREPEGRRV